MEQKTVGELEAAILNGDTTVTPERLIAAKRIAELTAERDAELAQAKKAKDEQVEREKTERADAVIKGNDHNTFLRKALAVIERNGARAGIEGAAVNIDKYRQLADGRFRRRPDV